MTARLSVDWPPEEWRTSNEIPVRQIDVDLVEPDGARRVIVIRPIGTRRLMPGRVLARQPLHEILDGLQRGAVEALVAEAHDAD